MQAFIDKKWYKKFKIHWMKQFLKCYFILKSKYVIKFEKNYIAAENSDIIKI